MASNSESLPGGYRDPSSDPSPILSAVTSAARTYNLPGIVANTIRDGAMSAAVDAAVAAVRDPSAASIRGAAASAFRDAAFSAVRDTAVSAVKGSLKNQLEQMLSHQHTQLSTIEQLLNTSPSNPAKALDLTSRLMQLQSATASLVPSQAEVDPSSRQHRELLQLRDLHALQKQAIESLSDAVKAAGGKADENEMRTLTNAVLDIMNTSNASAHHLLNSALRRVDSTPTQSPPVEPTPTYADASASQSLQQAPFAARQLGVSKQLSLTQRVAEIANSPVVERLPEGAASSSPPYAGTEGDVAQLQQMVNGLLQRVKGTVGNSDEIVNELAKENEQLCGHIAALETRINTLERSTFSAKAPALSSFNVSTHTQTEGTGSDAVGPQAAALQRQLVDLREQLTESDVDRSRLDHEVQVQRETIATLQTALEERKEQLLQVEAREKELYEKSIALRNASEGEQLHRATQSDAKDKYIKSLEEKLLAAETAEKVNLERADILEQDLNNLQRKYRLREGEVQNYRSQLAALKQASELEKDRIRHYVERVQSLETQVEEATEQLKMARHQTEILANRVKGGEGDTEQRKATRAEAAPLPPDEGVASDGAAIGLLSPTTISDVEGHGPPIAVSPVQDSDDAAVLQTTPRAPYALSGNAPASSAAPPDALTSALLQRSPVQNREYRMEKPASAPRGNVAAFPDVKRVLADAKMLLKEIGVSPARVTQTSQRGGGDVPPSGSGGGRSPYRAEPLGNSSLIGVAQTMTRPSSPRIPREHTFSDSITAPAAQLSPRMNENAGRVAGGSPYARRSPVAASKQVQHRSPLVGDLQFQLEKLLEEDRSMQQQERSVSDKRAAVSQTLLAQRNQLLMKNAPDHAIEALNTQISQVMERINQTSALIHANRHSVKAKIDVVQRQLKALSTTG